MPIYEYRCGACGHEDEVMQKMTDAPLTDCPQCGVGAYTKLVSATGSRLKGGGWYETDFKTGSKKNVVESPSSTSTPTPATSTPKPAPSHGTGARPACSD